MFPGENNSKLFSRISVADYGILVDFVNRRQPNWKLPLIQIVLDWLAGLTFILVTMAGLIFLARQFPLQQFRQLPSRIWYRITRGW
jgi:hypothetical protein